MFQILLIFVILGLGTCAPLGEPETDRSLYDDIQDFINLLPEESITALDKRYRKNDAQFQAVIDHLNSSAFNSFMTELSGTTEVEELRQYLQFSAFIEEVVFKRSIDDDSEDVSEDDPIDIPENKRFVRSFSQISQYFDELEALVPVEEARQLFENKMETSPKFRNFYEAISRKEFKMKICIFMLVFICFEYSSSAPEPVKKEKSLLDEIQDFINLLPLEEILALGVRYEKTDSQFQEMIEHIKSKKFFDFLDQLRSSTEYRKVVTYLKNNGVLENRIFKRFINDVHENIYGDESVITPIKYIRIARSYRQFLDELEALLPIDKARQLFKTKMETSQKFRNFYEVIRRKEFCDLVDKVLELKIVKEELKTIRDIGIDMKREMKIDEEILGFPETFSISSTL